MPRMPSSSTDESLDVLCPQCKEVVDRMLKGTREMFFPKFHHKCGCKGRLYWNPNQGSTLLSGRKAPTRS